jgi:hypothetical protein
LYPQLMGPTLCIPGWSFSRMIVGSPTRTACPGAGSFYAQRELIILTG